MVNDDADDNINVNTTKRNNNDESIKNNKY